ncbi:helix-turn-helix domain-containing protein [Flavobacterium sp. XGLA_31]|uniref:helix-turn-helix domain-containing protein n=1 Tax=Flavobacterium sp. XGLA_31 TaxID=3447666 RepID=UPI003F33B62E
MKVSVKNMVCQRCILVVKQELEKNNLMAETVQLGEITFKEELSEEQLTTLKDSLSAHGFEVLDDRKAMIIEKVKNIIVETIHGSDEIDLKRNFSDIIAHQIPIDYNYISSIFSTTEGITIEQFIILQRIERVKELLVYNELTLSEIAYKLGYSNVQHLSTQFKKVTGLTPSHFKLVKENKRKSLDQL